jgi:hypothetical protein
MGDLVMDNNEEIEQEQEEVKDLSDSYILIEFDQRGSVNYKLEYEGVAPMQLLAIASALKVIGETTFIQQEAMRQQQEQMGKITTPGEQGIAIATRK